MVTKNTAVAITARPQSGKSMMKSKATAHKGAINVSPKLTLEGRRNIHRISLDSSVFMLKAPNRMRVNGKIRRYNQSKAT
jgi:hypothetical protein